jgi:putative PIN family toxin of toxin-antitoxin system
MRRVVFDTNVLVAGLRSRQGASFRALSLLGQGIFEVAVSVPLVLEYEDVLRRPDPAVSLTENDVSTILDYLCSIAHHQAVFYLWRPHLPDPKDDMLLELAVAARCSAIVTHNIRDFAGAQSFGISILNPGAFLRTLKENL